MEKNWAIPCQWCQDYPAKCEICTRINRSTMAAYLRKEVKVYLSEENRHNHYRKIKHPVLVELTDFLSCREAGRILGVSHQTVSRARRDLAKGIRWESKRIP